MMKTNLSLSHLILTLILINLSSASLVTVLARPAKLELKNLRTEYKVNPVGIDVLQPRLSWEIASGERGIVQSAYHIQVAETGKNLQSGKNLLWDTGKIESDQSVHLVYQGPALKSGQRVYWRARIWDGKNRSSGWGDAVFWELGLLQPSDWRAEWIQPDLAEDVSTSQPCPVLRKEFNLDGEVLSARAYVTCLGLYEVELNGQRVDDQVFTPGWTSYNKRLQYQTYDVTRQLQKGKNAVGVTLGDGWYRGNLGWRDKRNNYGEKLALLLQVNVLYADGQTEIIGTDASWKASTGPILMSDIYNGETYDARLELPGWSKVGFDDRDWQGVTIIDHSKDLLAAPSGPPVRKIQEIKPVDIIKTPKGETVFDLGQNLVGWVRLKVTGKAGDRVVLRHAEVLDRDGNLYTENLRSARQTIEYTLKGGAMEVFEPHFTFQGFRYVAIEGYPGAPNLETLTGIVIHSDMTPAGSFVCSNEMINQLQHNIQWGQKGNFLDVPTDCPQRDERMGWTGDAQVFSRTACFNMDAASFYTKWLKDLAADQYDNGAIPHVIPDVLKSGGSAAWADAGVIVPWTVYLYYGDKRILEEQYDSMKDWVGYIQNQAGDAYLWNTGHHFGDWLAFNTTRSDYPGATTDKDLIATAYFAYSTSLVLKTARVLGNRADAEKYAVLLDNIKQAFQQEFVTATGRLTSNTQTAYAMALAFDLLPENLTEKAAQRFADDVRNFKHITTGFVGAPLVCPVLSDNGYLDLAYMLLNRKEYPSWLYPITMGATTIWERWDGLKPDRTFQDAGMNSFNHYAYGAIGDWLYRVVAGINLCENEPGYKKIIFQPQPGGAITLAHASHHAMYGDIESNWKIAENRFHYVINVPANAHAQVILPDAKLEEVREGGKPLVKANGISNFYQKDAKVVVELGSGRYEFVYPWP